MLTVEKLIQTLPYEQQATMHRLREMVLAADPKIVETVKWGNPVYSRGRNLVSLVPHASYANVQLWNGACLCEKYKIIEGDGQTMRHVKVKYKGRNDFKTIAAIIRDALAPVKQ
jgi:hypothetical protein